jgi:hypothetical protein
LVIARREGWARALGVLVLVSGAGYAIDCVGLVASGHVLGFAKITFVGEIVLMFWLLWKGIRPSRVDSSKSVTVSVPESDWRRRP